MLISISFPICDFRSLIKRSDIKLIEKPFWLSPDILGSSEHHLRSFGGITRKKHDSSHISDRFFCNATHVFKLQESPIFYANDIGFNFKSAKEFHFESILKTQLNISLIKVTENPIALNELQINKLIEYILNINVCFKNNEETTILKIENQLINKYAEATVTHASSTTGSSYIYLGNPAIFLEIQSDENIEIPKKWRKEVWHCGIFAKYVFYSTFILLNGKSVKLFIFKSLEKSSYRISRGLRKLTLDIWSEKENGRNYCNNFKKHGLSFTIPESPLLQKSQLLTLHNYIIINNGKTNISDSKFKEDTNNFVKRSISNKGYTIYKEYDTNERNRVDMKLLTVIQNILSPFKEEYAFDVFICHNSKDKDFIRLFDAELQKRGIRTWLDECRLPPGQAWEPIIEKTLLVSKSVIITVGSNGLGDYQPNEINFVISQSNTRRIPIIPVILPDCTRKPKLSEVLSKFTWVDMRKYDKNPYDLLEWGILGRSSDFSI